MVAAMLEKMAFLLPCILGYSPGNRAKIETTLWAPDSGVRVENCRHREW
ncbi:hypothetical protein CORMATOL_02939 [Corynebacterium matruchotii ATCC 33806]|uniref:Uncharacterized protein n=1 Tax=Corynebacterium matruchotii ATCC 33806 TaxID=566549 RepID=C0E7F0_9CORY|nr:hypothetical protein CORMATOL_02939 [Corynebacterium matruchotii ATCC 33806]